MNYQQRELATISALAAMPGVTPQLESHIAIGMNTGLTEAQLRQVFDLIEKNISREQAETARRSLTKVNDAMKKSSSLFRSEKIIAMHLSTIGLLLCMAALLLPSHAIANNR